MRASGETALSRPPPPQDASEAFRKYYMENDIFLSPEGIMKVCSIIGCIALSIVFLGSGACAGAPGVRGGAGVLALALAAALALLYAAAALRLTLLAPRPCLYADIIICTVAGVLLLLSGVLSMTVCELSGFLDYTHGPLAVLTGALATGSGVVTHAAAMRRWDAGAGPVREPRPPLSTDHDV